jgi:hypothetical protein
MVRRYELYLLHDPESQMCNSWRLHDPDAFQLDGPDIQVVEQSNTFA